MDSDDDDHLTPPRAVKRPKTEWDDDQRAAVGREYRGGSSQRHSAPSMTDSERNRHARRWVAGGVPEGLDGEQDVELVRHDITSPIAMLERELDAEDHEAISRLRRRRHADTDDPVVIAYKLSKEIRRLREEERSNNEERANQLLELLDRGPGTEVKAAMGAMQDALSKIRAELGTPHSENKGTVQENISRGRMIYVWGARLAGVAMTLALGSAGYVVSSIRNSGAEEVLRAQDRAVIKDLQTERAQDRQEIGELKQEIRRLYERLKDKNQ